MKVFITGVSGFIGTHLRERLEKEGHTVIGMDNLSHPCKYAKKPEIKDTILNIDKYEKQVNKCEWIVHLAAQINVEKSLINPLETINTNTIGTYHVLEMAKKLDRPIIFASSTEIYGDKQTYKMNEKHLTNPKSPYAASKLGADGLCKAYHHSYGTNVIVVRNFNTFGKYQSDDKWGAVIAKFADRLIDNKPPIIFGDGFQKRDYMGYKDAIDFYMMCLEGNVEFGEEYNVGSGKNISINKLAELMIDIFNKKGIIEPIHVNPRLGEVKEFLCDNKKARKLGWKPDTDFKKLLKEYIGWKISGLSG